MFRHAWNSMVITAWSELYPGDLPFLENIVFKSWPQRAAISTYRRVSFLPGNSLYQGSVNYNISQPNPPTHGVNIAKKSLNRGLGTVCLVSLNVAVHFLYFHSLQPPIQWHTFNKACQSLSQPFLIGLVSGLEAGYPRSKAAKRIRDRIQKAKKRLWLFIQSLSLRLSSLIV